MKTRSAVISTRETCRIRTLLIRTSGEMRLSNFLLWQLAYAEIYVTPTLWPDFRGTHLLEGIAEYQKRERRYGGLNDDAHSQAHRTKPRHPIERRQDTGIQCQRHANIAREWR